MKNKLLVAIIIIVVLGFAAYVVYTFMWTPSASVTPQTPPPSPSQTPTPVPTPVPTPTPNPTPVVPTPVPVTGFDPLNATYTIDGTAVTLVNGKANGINVFGVPTTGDLNNDGVKDAAFIIVQNSSGSGTFYYVVAALNVKGVAQGTNAILLGDRIAPQNVQISNGQVIANYAERNPGEPMTTRPSVGVSKYMIVVGTELRIVNPLSK